MKKSTLLAGVIAFAIISMGFVCQTVYLLHENAIKEAVISVVPLVGATIMAIAFCNELDN